MNEYLKNTYMLSFQIKNEYNFQSTPKESSNAYTFVLVFS